jgi:hypothetical protein
MRQLFAAALVVAVAGLAGAQDKKDAPAGKADPTGTWKWSVERNGQTFETTLKLKMEGGKLTGTVTGRMGQETKIEDATVKDGEVKFKVTREFGGNKVVQMYSAKVSGDTLKGKVESERDGEKQTREFEAKRQKEEKK